LVTPWWMKREREGKGRIEMCSSANILSRGLKS